MCDIFSIWYIINVYLILVVFMMMIDDEDDDDKRGWRDDYEDGDGICFIYFVRKRKLLFKNRGGLVMIC